MALLLGKRPADALTRLVRKHLIRDFGIGTLIGLTQQAPHQSDLAFEASAVAAHPQMNAQPPAFAKTQRPVLAV